jgi:transposase
MKNIMDKLKIITLKEQGYSNRKVAKMSKCDRKTVEIYWNEYLDNKNKLGKENANNFHGGYQNI